MTSNLSLIYDKNIDEIVYKFYIEIINSLLDQDAIVIDCGCGSGNLTKYLESISKQVFAFDIDEHMIDLASKKTSKTIYKVWDMQEPWPFYGDVVIMSMDVINFTHQPFQVIDHAIHSIDENGSILIDLYDPKIDLNYAEESNHPILYKWQISHHENMIKHTIKIDQEVISVLQYIHDPLSIKKYLINKGFKVKIIKSIDPRKKILICRR